MAGLKMRCKQCGALPHQAILQRCTDNQGKKG